MNQPTSVEHESLYIQAVPFFLAVLIMLGMLIGGAMISAESETTRLLAVKLIIGGVVVGVAGVLSLLLCISRRRWRLTEQGLEVQQGLAILPRVLAMTTQVPFDEIVSLSQIFMGARETIALTTRTGKVFRLMVASNAPLMTELMVKISRTQGKPLPLREGLGFWASRTLLLLLIVAFVFSVIIASASLWALFDGGLTLSAGAGGSAKGMGVMVVLPFGLLYAVRQILKRRQRVFKANEAGVAK